MKAKLEQEYIVRSAKRAHRKKKNTLEETRPRKKMGKELWGTLHGWC